MSNQRHGSVHHAKMTKDGTHVSPMRDTHMFLVNAGLPIVKIQNGQDNTPETLGLRPLLILVQEQAALMPRKRILMCSETRTQSWTAVTLLSKRAALAVLRRAPQKQPGPEARTQYHARDGRTNLRELDQTGYQTGLASMCGAASKSEVLRAISSSEGTQEASFTMVACL